MNANTNINANNLNEDIVSLLLRVEHDYHVSMENALVKSQSYTDERKKEQSGYIENLKHDWQLFEKSENDKLEKTLAENERILEAKMTEFIEQLKTKQKNKADMISERLKKEVILLDGDS